MKDKRTHNDAVDTSSLEQWICGIGRQWNYQYMQKV